MRRQDAITQSLELIEKSEICMLGTNGKGGFPDIKAMLNLKHEGLKKIWFSTNTSSSKVGRLQGDNRACVYYVDEENHRGLMLIGTIEILQDFELKQTLWKEGYQIYYPLGVEDPDYSVLCFTAFEGNYYHALKNITFAIN